MINQWKLKFITYSGMSFPLEEGDQEDVAKAAAAYLRRSRKRGEEIITLTRRREWEIQTQSNIEGEAITDRDGYLKVVEPKKVDCFVCGYEFAPYDTEHRICPGCDAFAESDYDELDDAA